MTHHAPIVPPGTSAADSTPAAQSAAPPSDAPPSDAPEAAAAEGPRWTPAKMAAFLRQLSATHSVSAAAKSVGMSRQSAYKLRSRMKGKPFDVAWDAAFHQSYVNLPYAALDRAINGIEVPHYYKGELVGTSRRYDERLTVALLKLARNPHVLVVGGHEAAAARKGQRFEELLARIEVDGENAVAEPSDPAPVGESGADSTDLSSWSDEELMAELRRFDASERG